MVLADANAHAGWDLHQDPDDVGEELEAWVEDSGWSCLNSGEATLVGPRGSLFLSIHL